MTQENIELHQRGVEALDARVLCDELAAETTASWHEDGRATRSVGYLRRREALEAVGLQG